MAVGVNIVSNFDSKGISKAIRDFQKLESAGDKSTFALRTMDKAVVNGVQNFAKMAAGVAVAAGAIGFKLASAAYESQKVMAQTAAIIKSTGGAAGVTALQVGKLSDKLSMQIGVDDELIQKSANLLLTFKQVQNQTGANNQIFDRAVIAAQDLGNVFGSADAAAMQLGKALSDPEKGITALRRAGINFTDQQKEQIKTLVASGDVLSAQKLILAEVESQVGGTAAATATGFDKMRVAVDNVAEKFGALLLPYIEQFANFVVQKVVPYLNTLADVIGKDGVGGGIKMLAGDFVDMTTNMGKLGNTILVLAAAFTTLRLVSIAATISQNLFNVALFSNPIGITVAAVIALGVALVALYLKFEIVRKVVNSVINFIIGLLENWLNAWIRIINLIIDGINLLIKAANLFGAGLKTIGHIGEVEFGRIGSAANDARKQIGSVAEVTGAMAAKEGGVQKVVKALNDVASAAGGTGGGGGGGAAKAVETAQEKLQKYVDAMKGLTSAQRQYRDATKSVLKADTDLLEAKMKLADAQDYFNMVTKGYGANSKQAGKAQTELSKAQRDVEKAGYDVETAVFAVKKAEADLASVRADPEASAQAVREAEINLAEAKLNVVDATDAQTKAVDDLNAAQVTLDETINGAKENSDTYKNALNDLKKAQQDVTDKIDAQVSANERLRDSIDSVREAQEKLDAVQSKTPKGLQEKANAILNAPAGVMTGGAAAGVSWAAAGLANAVEKGLLTQDQANALEMRRYTPFAKGGIVTSPTLGLLAEAGQPEAVIPLDQLGGMGGNTYITVNAGMGVDGAEVGKQIIDAIKKAERRSGKVFASA